MTNTPLPMPPRPPSGPVPNLLFVLFLICAMFSALEVVRG